MAKGFLRVSLSRSLSHGPVRRSAVYRCRTGTQRRAASKIARRGLAPPQSPGGHDLERIRVSHHAHLEDPMAV